MKLSIHLGVVATFLLFSGFTCSQEATDATTTTTADTTAAEASITQLPPDRIADHMYHPWVDSVLNSMTEEERIAQLFMVAAYSNKDQAHVNQITKLVEETKIGGLIFFQGGPGRQAILNNLYQSKAQTPLLVSIDGEWGLAMRLDSTIKYPRQMMLGAIQDDSIVYRMGADIAEQCKRMGIHVNLAPVVDVNNNPNNPVIGSRSFGEDKENVARKGIAYMKGLQDNNVLTTAKHFPGHGDTDSDSHKTLPTINHPIERLQELELYPFRELIAEGLGGMMVAHLNIPALDSTGNGASTLSKDIVTGLLKEQMGFDGLIFTDALNMKGVSAYYKPGVVDNMALLAGNDVLLFAEDVPTAIGQIINSKTRGEITQEEIDHRVRKILAVKHWCGLAENTQVELANLYEDLNHPKYELNQRQIARHAVTLLKNDGNLLPFRRPDTMQIATVSIGARSQTVFQTTMDQYASVKHFTLPKEPTAAQMATLKQQLKDYDAVVVGIHDTNERHWKNYGISQSAINFVNDLRLQNTVVLDLFANPYSLRKFYGAENLPVVVMSYVDNAYAQEYSAQMLFGGISSLGRLPVTASDHFQVGQGIMTEKTRFEFTSPDDVGMNPVDLDRIDSIALQGIKDQAYPGCQIVVARKGKVVYQKSFGHHTYEGKRKVQNSDIYDLASITKIASSTLSLMRLQDEGKFNLDATLGDYLPELVGGTPYELMKVRDMLAHQAGLVSWIPFYTKTLDKGKPKAYLYSSVQSDEFPHLVAENLYMQKNYPDTILQRIVGTDLRATRDYKYSDLGYYFFQQIIEKLTGMPQDEYVMQTFYEPMGLRSTGYRPLERFGKDRIIPTEYDMAFRKQLVHGHVHDPGAAMMGGVCGHAGLFSNATDLAAIMQLMLDWGIYGGQQYLTEHTIKEYTKCQFCKVDGNGNRRGAGFDKPVRNAPGGPTCECVSYESFGHSGFTGTIAWADPNEDVVYIFLSNRIYPDAKNKKLITSGIRTQIMSVIYDSISNFEHEPSVPLAREKFSQTVEQTTTTIPVPPVVDTDTLKGPAGK